ncbi:hypothetical protein DESA109040_14300 [Deinococcus saxicola]|uniref:hypothetical protein n=1 Tax=Deinococcus saxicola TaxID=249406 RepID=UPI0039EEF4EB
MTALTLADEASFYRAALLGGLIDPAQVIAWADAWIMREARVPDGIINVSLSGGQINRIADALGQLEPEHLTEGGWRLYAGLLRKRWINGTLQPVEIAALLYGLVLSRYAPLGLENELRDFSDDFELVMLGLTPLEEQSAPAAEERLWAFLDGWA